ncbi:MAG: methionyl-tRNA formyltransferase, partial [Defluviitaleaceae bacterium]|nr:methionyl-tRNA formyltransferase [Defluviitaleaceae bacterium]
MRLIFMGTPEIAVNSLKELAKNYDVIAVYSQPDRPAGRGKKLIKPAVKIAAENLGIEVFQPESL